MIIYHNNTGDQECSQRFNASKQMVMIGKDPGFFLINFLLYLLSLHSSESKNCGLLLFRDIECIDEYPFHGSSHDKQSTDESRSY